MTDVTTQSTRIRRTRAQGTGVTSATTFPDEMAVDEIVAALAAQDEELAGLLTGRSDDDWHRPSPCEGWDVADVVLHVAQTNELGDREHRRRLPRDG